MPTTDAIRSYGRLFMLVTGHSKTRVNTVSGKGENKKGQQRRVLDAATLIVVILYFQN